MTTSEPTGHGPIRLLIFAESLRGRGTERAVVRLLRSLDRDVVQPELVLLSAEGEFLPDVPPDVPIRDLRLTERRPFSAFLPLYRVVSSVKPDCILGVHTAPGRLLGFMRLLRPGTPVISFETDLFSIVEESKGNPLVRRFATAISHRLVSKVIASSDPVAEDFMHRLWLSEERVRVIPNPCVDAELYRLAGEHMEHPAYSSSERPVVVTIGNMFEHKAQNVLLDGFSRLLQERPANLVLIGEGPLRENLQRLCVELQIADRVWFLGFQRNPFKYLARAALFVSSSNAEGFDLSQVEAMACGVPVIVTDVPRYKAVEHGETGLLVPPNDPDALASAMAEVLSSPRLASRLAANARRTAADLSADKIARRYEAIVLEVVSGKRSRPRTRRRRLRRSGPN